MRSASCAVLLLAIGTTAITGCRCDASGPAATTPADDLATTQARESVQRYFTLLTDGDCESARELMPDGASVDCVELISEWHEHGVLLEEILEVRRDGRDPSAYIVRARIRRGSSVTESLVRAQRTANGWTVRM